MPAKSVCPRCGQKFRSVNHLCAPTSVEKLETRRKAIAELTKPASK